MYEYKPRRIIKNEKGIQGRTQFAYSLGIQNLFTQIDSNENNAIKICAEVIKFKIETNTYPSMGSKNKNIRKLARWLSNIRSAKQGRGSRIFYPVLEQMAIEAGFPDMFNAADKERIACEQCQQLIYFMKNYNRYPSQKSKNKDERKLSVWLNNMRQIKKGNRDTAKFYASLERMVIEAGFPDMFNISDNEIIACELCQQLIDFITEHGRNPSKESQNTDEKKLGIWLSNMCKAKKDGLNGSKFYPVLEQMAINAGVHNLFDITDLEAIACEHCQQLIDFITEHGRNPTRSSKNKDERKLAQWLDDMRKSKKGKGSRVFYDILEWMVRDAGFPTIFNNIDNEQSAIDICNKVIEFVNEHGHYPLYRYSLDGQNIGIWLSNMRYKNIHKNILYPILVQMATKAKLPNMFNSNWKDDLK